MKCTYFIGIDISKKTIDVAFCSLNQPKNFQFIQVENSVKGFKQLLTWLRKYQVKLDEAFFGMEHTGVYSLALSFFLQEKNLAFGMYNPLELKRS